MNAIKFEVNSTRKTNSMLLQPNVVNAYWNLLARNNRLNTTTKRLLFYWTTSFVLAALSYYVLWLVMPDHWVFGATYRMFVYHWEHPIAFIVVPCFFYGIVATAVSNTFRKTNTAGQILLTVAIVVVTILLSCPVGGMLWHLFDMQAGFFPTNWVGVMVFEGWSWGFKYGWLVIALSVPYNIFGSVVCFFLTRKGSNLL